MKRIYVTCPHCKKTSYTGITADVSRNVWLENNRTTCEHCKKPYRWSQYGEELQEVVGE